MICPNCHQNIPDGSRFCTHCGESFSAQDNLQMQTAQPVQPAPAAAGANRSWVVAIVAIVAVAAIVIAALFIYASSSQAEQSHSVVVREIRRWVNAPSSDNTSSGTSSQTENSSGFSGGDTHSDSSVTRYVADADGYANVRTGRGTNYSVVGSLSNGARVHVYRLRNGWYQIASGDYSGYYISQNTLSKDYSADTEAVYTVSEPDGYANVRTGRGTAYSVAGSLSNGNRVRVKNLRDGWYEIATGEYEGYYISSKTLE